MADAEEKKTKANTPAQAKKVVSTNAASPKKTLERIKVKRTQPRSGRRSRDKRKAGNDDGYDSRIVSIRRVTRVYKGGKRMRLSTVVVVGDKKGNVGIGVGKGADVKAAEEKAVSYAKKHLVHIEKKGDTIAHDIQYKKGAAKVFLKPAAPGTGIIAGSSVRAVIEMAGIKDILTKVLGSRNSINNAYVTLEALASIKTTRI
ncbi:30S ribosomal protein S5 [Candidatus Dojkabacteria bacterium]|nr:30S ribosomal protein S5 [Candidatus Dojkabacteria bacterium]